MPAWYVYAAVWAGTTLLSYLLRPKPRTRRDKNAPFNRPNQREGGRPAWGFGSFIINDPVVLEFLNARVVDVKKDGQVVGANYYAGVQFGCCIGPVQEWQGIEVNGIAIFPKSVQWLGDRYRVYVKSQGIGTRQPDPLDGYFEIYLGTQTQDVSSYLAAKTGGVGASRGLVHAVAEDFMWGPSPSMPRVAFRFGNYPNSLGLTGNKHTIVDQTGSWADANAACVIWEKMTASKDQFGAGIPASRVDKAALVAIGEALYAEGFGVSGVLEGGREIEDHIDELCRTCGIERRDDPATGLISFKLIRDDYDPDDLPLIDVSNFSEIRFERSGWRQTKNMVNVTYIDRHEGFAERSTQEIDRSLIDVRGGQGAPEDVDLPFISTRITAQKAAARIRRARGYPVAVLTGKTDRITHTIQKGDPFRVAIAPLGILSMVFRCTGIRYGTPGDGRISIDAVEDIFGVAESSFGVPSINEWVDPGTAAPQSIAANMVIEAPYRMVRDLPLATTDPFAVVLANPGDGLTRGWNIWTNRADGSWYQATQTNVSAPRGALHASIGPEATSLVLDDVLNLDLLSSVGDGDFGLGVNLLWLADEFIAFRDVTRNVDGTFTLSNLARGCLDTVPKQHSGGAVVWILAGTPVRIGLVAPASGETQKTTRVLFQSFNDAGIQDLSQAVGRSLIVGNPIRAALPVAPADVRINGQVYPASITGQLSVTWRHRSRFSDSSFASSNATTDKEANLSYTLDIYGESGTLVRSVTGLVSTAYVYLTATEIADSGLGRLNNSLRIVLRAINGANPSYQEIDHTLARV